MNDTKIKGLVTELQCQLYFTKMGYNVSVPLGEDCRYDFIIDVDSILIRVQVKTCKIDKNRILIPTRSSRSNTKENKTIKYDKEEIDYFATFYNDVCYLIPVEQCSSTKSLYFDENVAKTFNGSYIYNYAAEKQLEKIKNGEFEEIVEGKIYQYDLRHNLINSFSSCNEAAKSLGNAHKNAHISQAVRGIRKTAYGYIWTDTLIK